MENKIERITKATAKSYINDGYKLLDYEFNEISQLAIYHIKHSKFQFHKGTIRTR